MLADMHFYFHLTEINIKVRKKQWLKVCQESFFFDRSTFKTFVVNLIRNHKKRNNFRNVESQPIWPPLSAHHNNTKKKEASNLYEYFFSNKDKCT